LRVKTSPAPMARPMTRRARAADLPAAALLNKRSLVAV